MDSSYRRRGLRGAVAPAAAAAALLAGCGSASPHHVSPHHVSPHGVASNACGVARGAVHRLVLSNVSPMPRATASEGAYVEVVSSYHGNPMSFPVARPADAVCQISRRRDRDGTAAVVYKALRPGTVTFSSSFTRATPLMMPAMLGRLQVR